MTIRARAFALGCLLLLGLVQGCGNIGSLPATISASPELTFSDAQRFGAKPVIPTPVEILTLTPAQNAAFLSFFNDPYYRYMPPHRRVFSYLQGFTDGFHYQGDTLTASEAFAVNGGNCLSLALMTTALADAAGVRIGYQFLDDVPVYEVQGTVVEKGLHVRSILYDPSWSEDSATGIWQPGLKVDYFATGQERFVANLTRAEFIAMYYRNEAATAITQDDYNTAYWYLRESLQYAINDSQAINMLAVVSRRTGDDARAEELYRYGLANGDEKLTLLKNYQVLLRAQQRLAEAEALQATLEQMPDPSPFHWFQLARESVKAGEYPAAIRYYRRALDLAPYMHEAHLGVAQAQHEIGNDELAVVALEKALENVYRPSTRKLYKAKLNALKHPDI